MTDSEDGSQAEVDSDPMMGNFISLCVAIHIVVDFMLIRGILQIHSDSAFAIVVGQLSLVAIWAATSRMWFLLRYIVSVAAVIGCWCLNAYLKVLAIGEPAAASWAITYFVQVGAIYAMITCYRSIVVAKRDGRLIRSEFKFDLLKLLLWTTGIAIVFGIYQFARSQLGWVDILGGWQFAIVAPMLGVVLGVIAAICLWPFAQGRWNPPTRFAYAGGALVSIVVLLSTGLSNNVGQFQGRELWGLLMIQAATVTLSLAMITRLKPLCFRDRAVC